MVLYIQLALLVQLSDHDIWPEYADLFKYQNDTLITKENPKTTVSTLIFKGQYVLLCTIVVYWGMYYDTYHWYPRVST